MSNEFFIASPRELPAIAALAGMFEGIEGDWRRGVTIARVVRASATTVKSAPAFIAKLPAAKRTSILVATGKAATSLDVLELLAGALNGQLFSEDGERLGARKPAAKKPAAKKPAAKKPAAKKPGLDVSIPPAVERAFVGAYLPVVVTRTRVDVTLPKLAAKLVAPQRERVACSRVARLEGAVGELALKEVDLDPYAPELAQVGIARAAAMLRVVPKFWYTEPTAADEEAALAIACGLARLGSGVLYARPGGRKLQSNGDDKVAVAFDFSSGDAVALDPETRARRPASRPR